MYINHNITATMGAILVLLGVASVVLGAVATAQTNQFVDLKLAAYHGYRFYSNWVGVVYILAGCFGYSASKDKNDRRKRNKMVAFLVFSTVAATVAVLLVNDFVVSIENDVNNLTIALEACNYSDAIDDELFTKSCTIIKLQISNFAIACAAFLVSVICSIFAWMSLCPCCDEGSQERGQTTFILESQESRGRQTNMVI
ncbi:uncharacterized protein [Amphiura filiformis]